MYTRLGSVPDRTMCVSVLVSVNSEVISE